MVISKLEYKRLLIQTYLNALGLSDTEKDVDELIFDAECSKLRYFHPSILNLELWKCLYYE